MIARAALTSVLPRVERWIERLLAPDAGSD